MPIRRANVLIIQLCSIHSFISFIHLLISIHLSVTYLFIHLVIHLFTFPTPLHPGGWPKNRTHSMMTSSNGNNFRVTCHLCGEFNGHRWIPNTKANDAELWCFCHLHPNKRLSKQWWGWWFETLSHPLWRHCNAMFYLWWRRLAMHDRVWRFYIFLMYSTIFVYQYTLYLCSCIYQSATRDSFIYHLSIIHLLIHHSSFI